MIKIEFSLAIALYLILMMCLIFLAIILENRKAQKQFSSEKNFLWQCSICTYAYVDSMRVNISRCPQCGSYNNKDDVGNGLKPFPTNTGGKHA